MRTTMRTTIIALLTLPLTLAWGSPFYYASSGCDHPGFKLDSTGHLNRTLPSGRTYLLHVPNDYFSGSSHPLVLSFHGGECSGAT